MKKAHSDTSTSLETKTGFVIPLGAIVTKKAKAIGEYTDLELFIPLCKKTGMNIIQLLPVNDTGTQTSPYSSLSAFALHPIYIDIAAIPDFDKLYNTDTAFTHTYNTLINLDNPTARFNYQQVLNVKNDLLYKLYEQTDIAKTATPSSKLTTWIKHNPWIVSYVVFKQLKYKYMQASWKSWPKEDQNVTNKDIEKRWNDTSLKKEHLFYVWQQYIADAQFSEAAAHLKKEGIILKGDIPIMMNEDSCDAWSEPTIFNHTLRAGSPPDGENPYGQTWGFPIYQWQKMKKDKYQWWKNRLQTAARYYGAYRLDHILGFFRIWAVPEADTTAYLGHVEPYVGITREMLHNAGFDDGRIHWLSEPHVPTQYIEDITHNHAEAVDILSQVCDRIGNEELWNFNKKINGSSYFFKHCPEPVQEPLCKKWKDRCLIEVKKDTFVPIWCYGNSTAWRSLYHNEQDALRRLFDEIAKKQNELWKKQAQEILSELTQSVDMQPCGEDLGVSLECVPEVLQQNNILGLRVVRWSRIWDEPGQPYIPFEKYTPLSLTTTSVHDSSTLRQWWNNEKDSARQFVRSFNKLHTNTEITSDFDRQISQVFDRAITPLDIEKVLCHSATTASVWYVNPLQDYLFMDKTYWRKDEKEERINIPGTVTEFNWSYRIPAAIETITANKKLVDKITNIVVCHRTRSY